MNQAVTDHFRCADGCVDFDLTGRLSDDAGYFKFGSLICYGRSASGFRASRADTVLYDVLEDAAAAGSHMRLPFDPTEIIDNLRFERYAKHWNPSSLGRWKQFLRNAYYSLRPWMHASVRKRVQRVHLKGWQSFFFPHWPVDTTVEDLCERLLLLSMKAKGIDRVPFVWFWPEGARSCVLMTHDIETEKGKAFCTELMNLDDAFGIKASIQVVPETRYQVSHAFLDNCRSRGFEINIQDLNHDGHLFSDRDEFMRRAERINAYFRAYGTRGFRAAALYRNPDWYDALQMSFDMSVPNVAHLDPQRGGCCTVMPYFVGDIVEIPLTTTQDYMQFQLLNDYSLDLWRTQTKLIMGKNGLVSFIVHPDYIIEHRARGIYRDLLSFLREVGERERAWFTVGGEIDDWWRARSKMRVVKQAGEWRIEGEGRERAQLAFARAAGDRLEYEVRV
jgi:hypothetical protein